MDKAKALKMSIEKWQEIINGTTYDHGSENCQLCINYYDYNCDGCPVKAKTEKEDCFDTPYYKWSIHHHNDHKNPNYPYKIICETCKELAENELEFLKDL